MIHKNEWLINWSQCQVTMALLAKMLFKCSISTLEFSLLERVRDCFGACSVAQGMTKGWSLSNQ